MKELTNESHGDENFIDINSEDFKAVCRAVIDRLTSGDKDTRAMVIDGLINSNFFWDSALNMSDMPSAAPDYNNLISNAYGIKAAIHTEVMFQATKELEE